MKYTLNLIASLFLIFFLFTGPVAEVILPERPRPDKSVTLAVQSDTRMIIYDRYAREEDSTSIYETKSNSFQSLSLELAKGPMQRYGVSSNLDIFSIGVNNFDWKLRTQIFNISLRNTGFIKDLILGRQNTFTGFRFYKFDGLSTNLKVGEIIEISGLVGTQVDSTMALSGLENTIGHLQVKGKFGFRSQAVLGFERALFNDNIIANGINSSIFINLWSLVLKGKAQLSFAEQIKLNELQLYAQYRISRRHSPYLGFTAHDPLFEDPMTIYFYNVFKSQEFYGGWRYRPLKNVHLYLKGEYGFSLIHDLLVHNLRLSLLSPYGDLIYAQRFGDLSGAGMIDISIKYPVHKMFTIGVGLDYHKMDIVNKDSLATNLVEYYGYVTFTPFKKIYLNLRLEDRNDSFYKHDIRLLLALRIGYMNRHGDLFKSKNNE